MNPSQTALLDVNPGKNKFLTIIMGALLFGFAWQIRGNGTSDPSVVILLFLLFLSIHYSPRQKFNLVIFAFAIFVFGIMRTGWGTFNGQAGIPGLSAGHIKPDGGELLRKISYDIVVPWWHGYFWLFIVGIAWGGLPSLIFGGYFFTRCRYYLRDLAVCLVLFVVGRHVAGYIAELFIPLIAGEYYHQVYLPGISTRNYLSMRGNLSSAIAIVPVLFYLYFGKKDPGFVRRSLIVMVIFGVGLSGAAFWHALGGIHPEWGLPFWSLWEYFSGFIIGCLIFWFYGRFSEKELQESDISPGLESIDQGEKFGQFVIYATALYFAVLYGMQESISGSMQLTCAWLGIEMFTSQETIRGVLLVVVLPLYYFYRRGDIGSAFFRKSFREKSLIAFILLVPVNYLVFLVPYIVAGRLSQLNNSAVWLDTISFAVVEIYALWLYRQFRRSLDPL